MPPPKRRRRWEPSPADLPTEKAQAAEPRLRGLENNPVFRVVTFYQSHESSHWGPVVWVSHCVLGGALVSLIGGWEWLCVVLLGMAFVGFMIPLSLAGRLGSFRRPYDWPVPLFCYKELSLTIFKSDEFINALWGSKIRRRSMRGRRSAFYGMILITLMVILAYEWLAWDLRWPCSLALFVLGSLLGGVRFDPYHVLDTVRREIKNQRRIIERKHNPFWAWRELVKAFVVLLAICAFLVFVTVMLVLLTPALVILFKESEWLLEYMWVFQTHFGGLALLAIGWLIGRSLAGIERSRTPKRLKRMREDINRIMDIQLMDQGSKQ